MNHLVVEVVDHFALAGHFEEACHWGMVDLMVGVGEVSHWEVD